MSMSATIRQPSRSDWWLIGIFWTAALPFIFMDYPEMTARVGWLRFLTASVWSILMPCLWTLTIIYWLVPGLLFRRAYLLFIMGLVVSAFFYGSIYQIVDLWLFEQTPIYTIEQLSYGILSLIRSVGILSAILVAKQFHEVQQKLLRTEKERTEAELRHLKAQIDPHFLFNNLNVLDALIQRNPEQASAYLHRFAALYRYLIRHKDDDVVPLADELAFVSDYNYLIRQRFGRAYEVLTHLHVTDALAVFVLPGSIQTLIENAVKHNGGSETDPLLIELTATDETVTVGNELRPKLTVVDSTGTGLKNLQTRYRLLSDRNVVVESASGEFRVTLPVLKQEKPQLASYRQ